MRSWRWNRVYHVFDESFKKSASVVKYSNEPYNPTKAKYAARGAQKSSWIPLLGLSSTIQILPMGNSDLISGYGSMTALEKVPVIMGKKWKIVLFRQQVLAKLGIRDHLIGGLQAEGVLNSKINAISWVRFFAWTEIGLLRWGFRMTSEIANMRLLMVLPTLSRLL
ncbi:hypothetical protein Tco_1133653, partial [Tanacetum coccineum]